MIKDWIPKIEIKLGKTLLELNKLSFEEKTEALVKIDETINLLNKLAQEDFNKIVKSIDDYLQAQEGKLNKIQSEIVSYSLEANHLYISKKNGKVRRSLKPLSEIKEKLKLRPEFLNIQLAYLMSPKVYLTLQLLETYEN